MCGQLHCYGKNFTYFISMCIGVCAENSPFTLKKFSVNSLTKRYLNILWSVL